MSVDGEHGGDTHSGTGGGVKVEPADVRAIAKKHIATAADAIAVALAAFEDTADGEFGFGGFEAGAELAGLHASVKAVFTQTVTGVTTDLSTYHQNLIAGANAWEAADANSADRSKALIDRLSAAAQQPLASERNWHDSRQEQGESLGLGENLRDQAEEPKPDSSASTGGAEPDPSGSTAGPPPAVEDPPVIVRPGAEF